MNEMSTCNYIFLFACLLLFLQLQLFFQLFFFLCLFFHVQNAVGKSVC